MSFWQQIKNKLGIKTANDTRTIEHCPELVMTLKVILSHTQSECASLVGGVYASSHHNNEKLVYQSIGWADEQLERLLEQVDDNQLLAMYINQLTELSNAFTANLDDPDGVASGTLVDLIKALKRFQEKEQ